MKCVTPARVFVAWLAALAFLAGSGSASAQATAPAAGGHQRVLIFPFTQVNPAGKLDWLAHGIQEDIMTELNSSRGMQAMTPAAGQNTAPADINAAVDLGRQAGANYVVFGNYQASDTELRISGNVVDVNDPDHGAMKLKVTGPLNALFHLQDALDSQVENAVGLGLAPQAQPQPQAPATAPPEQNVPNYSPPSYQAPAQSPSETYIGPYNSPDYTYSDPGSYGDDGYGYTPYTYAPYYYGGVYPYYGYGLGFYGGAFFHNNNFHHAVVVHSHGSFGGGFHGGGHMGMGMGGGGGHMGGGGGGRH